MGIYTKEGLGQGAKMKRRDMLTLLLGRGDWEGTGRQNSEGGKGCRKFDIGVQK